MTDAPTPVVLRHGKLTDREVYLRENLDVVLAAVEDMARLGIELMKHYQDKYTTEERDRARIDFVAEVCRRWADMVDRLSEDQGSSPAAIPTEGVTASGDDDVAAGMAAFQRKFDRQMMTTIAAHLRDHPAAPYSGRQCEEMVMWARDEFLPVENSPSPTLGGTEAEGRSEQKDHPTPVGGLEPVAFWNWNRDLSRLPAAQTLLFLDPVDADGAQNVRLGLSTDAMNAEAWSPLPGEGHSSSTVSTLQAENKRLREALRRGVKNLSKSDAHELTRICDTRDILIQAIGGQHD